MNPDPEREQIAVPEILIGLADLEKCLGSSMSDASSALQPFKIACKVYEQQFQSPFGIELAYETEPFRECVMFVAASMDLVRYFRLVRHKPQLKALREHLTLIAPGFFGVAATYGIQMSKGSRLRTLLAAYGITPPTDSVAKDAARKTVELMLAMAAMNSFDKIVVENPKASSATDPNPDLIVQHAGKRFGVACKSLSTLSEETFKERVAEGLVQLERAIAANRVDPIRGVVLLDVSAILDHEKLYLPAPDCRWPKQDSGDILRRFVDEALQKMFALEPTRSFQEILGSLYRNRRLPFAVLIYAHAVMLCEMNGHTCPVYQKALRYGGDTSSIVSFCKRLDRALHCQPSRR
jgi:hypothetical protein